jgi:hypothetical protein
MRFPALLLLLSLATILVHPPLSVSAAARPKALSKPNSPFGDFQIIDKRLSALDAQIKQAQELVSASDAGARATSSGRVQQVPWTAVAKAMLRNSRSLHGTTRSVERRYRHSRTARKLVAPLARSTQTLIRAVSSFAGSSNITGAQRALNEVRDARLRVMTSFQAASGDYGALRCPRGQWACGQLTNKNGQPGCHWDCVARSSQCKSGWRGSRSQAASDAVIRR